jgi:pimeloyl-ACP methyl ester carboxylesterase
LPTGKILDVDRLRTADGQLLRSRWYDGPGSTCVVLAHGFSGSIDKPGLRRVAEALSRHASVLAFDARGHGRSTGVTTLGEREVLDVDAAVAAARQRSEGVVTCGWSMGGSTVIRHAALRGTAVDGHLLEAAPDAVVSVSATSRWFVRDTAAMRRLHWVVERRTGRLYARRVMGTRVSPRPWEPLPESPVECVARIAPLPLLVVHGDRDGYFPVEHPHALVEAAREPVELWLEPGFGHAESAAAPELLDRLGRHLPVLLERAA